MQKKNNSTMPMPIRILSGVLGVFMLFLGFLGFCSVLGVECISRRGYLKHRSHSTR